MAFIEEFVRQYSYYVIFVLTVIVYQLGFARRLPLLKTLIIYVMIALGSVLLKIFHAMGLPMILSLTVAALMLIIYRAVRFFDEGSKTIPKTNEKGGES